MPRPLHEFRTSSVDASEAGRDLGVTRRTSRSFAAAVALLLLATLVANRSSAALSESPANAGAAVTAGTIRLDDDDDGRSLFDLDALSPVAPVERCIEIEYSGSILPVELRMQAEAGGGLRDFLDITVDVGSDGDYESCDGFIADEQVYDGTLAGLVDAEWIEVGRFVNTDERRSFRISIRLQDELEATGLTTSLGFGWEAVPS